MPPSPEVLTLRTKEDVSTGLPRRMAELLAMDEPPPLEIRLEADLPLPANVVWGNLEETPALDISVDGGGHRWTGVHIRVEGRRVRLTSLRLDGGGRGGQLLELVGSSAIDVEDVVLANTPAAPTGKGARVPVGALQLTAAGASVRARVTRALLLDHRAPSSVRVTSRGGGAGFSEVVWQQGRFAATTLPLFELGVVRVFSAPGTQVLGQGEPVRALPATLVIEAPTVSAEDATQIAAWRAEL